MSRTSEETRRSAYNSQPFLCNSIDNGQHAATVALAADPIFESMLKPNPEPAYRCRRAAFADKCKPLLVDSRGVKRNNKLRDSV